MLAALSVSPCSARHSVLAGPLSGGNNLVVPVFGTCSTDIYTPVVHPGVSPLLVPLRLKWHPRVPPQCPSQCSRAFWPCVLCADKGQRLWGTSLLVVAWRGHYPTTATSQHMKFWSFPCSCAALDRHIFNDYILLYHSRNFGITENRFSDIASNVMTVQQTLAKAKHAANS